jgi:hypothetical protein
LQQEQQQIQQQKQLRKQAFENSNIIPTSGSNVNNAAGQGVFYRGEENNNDSNSE